MTSASGHLAPGHSVGVIERRPTKLAETSEQRVLILRGALADFAAAELAQRNIEIALLKNQVAELTSQLDQKSLVDQQVHEIAMRLDARASARDEAKRGPKENKGERGARGERGLPGALGPRPVTSNPNQQTLQF